jgi:hypothetical protein
MYTHTHTHIQLWRQCDEVCIKQRRCDCINSGNHCLYKREYLHKANIMMATAYTRCSITRKLVCSLWRQRSWLSHVRGALVQQSTEGSIHINRQTQPAFDPAYHRTVHIITYLQQWYCIFTFTCSDFTTFTRYNILRSTRIISQWMCIVGFTV